MSFPGSPGARCGLESSGRQCVQQSQSVTQGLGCADLRPALHPSARGLTAYASAGAAGRARGLPRAGQTGGDREAQGLTGPTLELGRVVLVGPHPPGAPTP